MSVKPQEDHFSLFDLPRAYDLDLAALAERYRSLQRATHPDRFAAAEPADRRLAVSRTAALNTAFQTLKDPVRRAAYLLSLKGIDTDDETDTVMDPAFLMQQMELREQLEDARHQEVDQRRATIERLAAVLRQEFGERSRAFAPALATDPDRARALVREMRFLRKLEDELARSGEEIF